MRINGNSPLSNRIVEGGSTSSTRTEQSAAADLQDQTSFSSDSMSATSLQARAMQTPDIRQDRVAALKDAISKGQYKIEPEKIAESMLNEYAG